MSITGQLLALLPHANQEALARMRPADRERLAQWCRHVAAMAEPGLEAVPRPKPKRTTGVLVELSDGHRAP